MSVVVEQYKAEWPSQFQQIKLELESYLDGVPLVSIEHVGSTSVPGLAAKPIIDIDIIVTRENVQQAVVALAGEGNFTYMGELGIKDRHSLQDPNQSPHRNIYVCVEDAFQTRNHLAVRDTLRSNPTLRDEYGRVKFDLAARGINIVDYVEAKGEVLQKVLQEAGVLTKEELDAVNAANMKGERIGATKTDRLTLREFVMADVGHYHALESIPEVVRYQNYHPLTLDQAHMGVVTIIRNSSVAPRRHIELAVIHTNDNVFIGRVGMKNKHKSDVSDDKVDTPHASLWYSFKPEHQGQGFATEAVKKFIELLKTPIRLEIECDPRNMGSVKMAKRLGFKKVSVTEKSYESKGEWVGTVVFHKVI